MMKAGQVAHSKISRFKVADLLCAVICGTASKFID
jgi:hypothetical protein